MHRRKFLTTATGGLLGVGLSGSWAARRAWSIDSITKGQARASLQKAVAFFREKVSMQGGYLWRFSEDLEKREGEKKASASQAWVQPPGTPSVGGAFLSAFEVCGEECCYDAAKETALALCQGQLRSGGWDYEIEFDAKKRAQFAYRSSKGDLKAKAKNVTTFDDNTSQAALVYLLKISETMKARQDASFAVVDESARFACDSFVKAQYPNGAWPQRYAEFPEAEKFPIVKAGYPESWSRIFPEVKYYQNYTFNDDSQSDVIAAMLMAERVLHEDRYRASAEKGGDFILLAQMPDPQPAWAQQYNAEMYPCWARKFEPPAVTGGESQGVLRTLMMLYRETGQKKYLEPVPRAIEYLRRSLLAEGKLARFYELKTNRPLYFTKKYELTYDDSDMPTHYSFKIESKLDSIDAEYQRVQTMSAEERKPQRKSPRKAKMNSELADQARKVVEAMDERGAWVTRGTLRYHGADDSTMRVIDTITFIKNLGTLAKYLAAE